MIRLAAFLVLTAAFAFVAMWFADRPGEVVITWLGYRAETSVAVLAGTAAAVACAAVLIFSVLRMVAGAPAAIAGALARRRAARGRSAITCGLVAVGAGDVGAARRFAAIARRFAGGEPLALLLQAQAAQLAGERDGADAAFRAMAERADTKLFGLHGLFIEARRRNDPVARIYAEEAARTSPSLAWAGQAALEFRCADGDWPGALAALERNRQGGLVAPDRFRRQRAVLLTAQALSLHDRLALQALSLNDRDRAAATELAVEAAKLCPGLVAAAALAGRLLAEAGEPRKAARVLEAAWRENPHPDIADAYANLVPGAAARERLARMRTLARLAGGHPESSLDCALAVARAALDANEFAAARAALAPLLGPPLGPPLARPTRRVATLMARLEEAEHGDTGRAREWMARAVNAAHDPAWTADGLVAETWLPVSPATGRLDAFQWRVPVADLTPRGPLIDAPTAPMRHPPVVPMRQSPAAPAAAVAPAARTAEPAGSMPVVHLAAPASPLREPPPAMPENASSTGNNTAARAAAAPTAVPPHGPDDPGPGPEAKPEPVPKPKEAGSGWRSWFSRR
jgi:HemY protein